MCGIAGLLRAPPDFDLLGAARKMVAQLVHRGPDDEGIWTDPAVDLRWLTVAWPSSMCRPRATSR